MAEDTVVILKEQLTREMIEAGARLTQKLDEMGLELPLAMWLFNPEINEWRLVFSSPQLMVAGPRVVYQTIQEALDKLGPQAEDLPFSMISLRGTHDELVRVLRAALKTGPGIFRLRLTKNAVDGHFIDDALIYRSAA